MPDLWGLALDLQTMEPEDSMKILDMSAGNRAMWFDKTNPLVTFLDRRAEVSPTIVCDTSSMPPEVGGDYDLIVFDPPHANFGANGHMAKRYGHSTHEQIRATIRGSAAEAHRVSAPGALMALKWNDHSFKLDVVLEMMSSYWEPLFGSHMRNRGGPQAGSQSYWVMLRRKP